MSCFNIYYLRAIFNEQLDIDLEYVIEALKEDLKDSPEVLEEQLEIIENYRKNGTEGLRALIEAIVKDWLEVQSGKTQIKYYNMMVQKKGYDKRFVYTMSEFWDNIRELDLEYEKIAEGIVRGDFRPWDNYALMDESGRFYSSDYPEDLIVELEDIAEFMVSEDLLDEVE